MASITPQIVPAITSRSYIQMLAKLIVEALLDDPKKWMPPDLPSPVEKPPFDETPFATEDHAIDYLESEVGRHDWQHNWPQHKKNHGKALRDKVLAWLRHYEIDHDPDAIINYLDDMHKMRPGKWS